MFSSLFNAHIRHFLVSTCQSFEQWTKRLFRAPSGENLRTSSLSFPQIQSHRNFLDFFVCTSPQTCLVAQLARPSVRLGGQRKDSPQTYQFSSPRAEDSQQSNRDEDRENAKRDVYRSSSLHQKLEIVHYACSTAQKMKDDDI